MELPTYLEGIYRVTPMGKHTEFECLICPVPAEAGDGYLMLSLKTHEAIEISPETLTRMRPVFIRKVDYGKGQNAVP